MASSASVSRTQAIPSSAAAPGSPVSKAAASAYLASAGWPGLAPVQASTRDPCRASSAGRSADRPGPKMTRPAVANSNASTPAPAYPASARTAQPPAPAGKTAENLADARGSAIISATVSRQVA